MREGTLTANGLRFAFIEDGAGPVVLLVHGYPDNARTWSHLMPELARAGYRAVAIYTRGYPPSEIPVGGYYDSGTLATDLQAIAAALSDDPVVVIGHDWGAAATFYAIAAYPERFARAITLAIPHPLLIFESLTSPRQIHRSFHWWFFQLPDLPETAIRANDFAFIDYLWRYWSPNLDDPEHIAEVKRMLAEPGVVEATLGYYRAMFTEGNRDPALSQAREALAKPIPVETLSIIGGDDMRAEAGAAQAKFFAGRFAFESVPGCGHFLHREKPEQVAKLIVDWLRA